MDCLVNNNKLGEITHINTLGELILELSIFGVSFLISGFLYALVAAKLILGRRTRRIWVLSLALILLWLFWGLCCSPSLIYIARYRLIRIDDFFYAFTPSDMGYYIEERQPFAWRYKTNRVTVLIDIALRALRHSYSFINSLLLIILLRPFQKPIATAVFKLKNQYRAICSER